MRALYWQEVTLTEYSFDEQRNIIKHHEKKTREIRSANPLIDKIWFIQSLSEDKKTMDTRIEIIAGQRLLAQYDYSQLDINGLPINTSIKRFSKKVTVAQTETLLIPEAIEWINNLKPE